MMHSWISAALVVLCISTLGQCSSTQGEGWFSVNDRKFEHTWKTKTSMPDKRSDMTATTVGDAIYIVGGCALDQVWVSDGCGGYGCYTCGGTSGNAITGSTIRYLPKSDQFNVDLPNAPRPRYRHAAAAVKGVLYLLGGVDAADNIIQEVDMLDTTKTPLKWTTLHQKMPDATTDLSAFELGGRIYTTGGYDASWTALTLTQVFDPSLADGNQWRVGPSLLQGRGDAFAAVANGKAYVGGGFHHENDWKLPVNSMEMFSGQGNSFAAVKNMVHARGDKAVAVLNGILHVVGGETKNAEGDSVPLRDVEAYDPETDAWFQGGAIPSHRFRFVAAAHGDSLFIFGGQGFLQGTAKQVGSKYPVLDTVEAYTETVTTSEVNKAPGLLPMMPSVMLMTCALM